MIGKRLRKLRLEQGISQSQLAAKLGISQQAIGNYETDIREPDNETLKKIALIFNVSTDYLLGLSNQRHPQALLARENVNEDYPQGLENYDLLPEENKRVIRDLIQLYFERLNKLDENN